MIGWIIFVFVLYIVIALVYAILWSLFSWEDWDITQTAKVIVWPIILYRKAINIIPEIKKVIKGE